MTGEFLIKDWEIKLIKFIFWSMIFWTFSLLLGFHFTAADNPSSVEQETLKSVSVESETVQVSAKVGIGDLKTAESTENVCQSTAAEEPEYIYYNANRGGVANRKENDVLIHLINAEAYGLSYKAKVAVGQVVINRWKGPYYGDDLLAIMTAPYQFTPIYDGSAYNKEIEPDSIKAANTVLNGGGVDELTDDTYYFVNPDFTEDKTIEQTMEFVCEIEGIHFFRPPTQ